MATNQIGEIKPVFKPGLDNLIAGIIIGILMIVGGIALFWFVTNGVIESNGNLPMMTAKGQKGWCWAAVAMMGALGVGLFFGGIFLIRWVRSLFSFRVSVSGNGLLVSEKQNEHFINWDDIVSVQETHLYERPPLLKGVAKYALPKMMSKSFVINLKLGDPFVFDGNTIKGHVKLAEMVKVETEARGLHWEIVEEHA